MTVVAPKLSITDAAGFTPEQMQLITDTVAKGATPPELALFLHRCKLMGLNPLKPGQIHFVKYGTGPGSIVVGIEGFRSIAGRTGKLSGVERGVHRDDKGKAIAGWAKVYRSDWQHPAHEEVPMSEYNSGKGPWQKMPETMIKKVAEAAALRMAFPDVLGGVYEQSEMGADSKAAPVVGNRLIVPEQPEAGDGVQREGYFIPYGPFARKFPEDCDPAALRDWIDKTEAEAAKAGKPLRPWFEEAVEHCAPLIGAWENAQIEGGTE